MIEIDEWVEWMIRNPELADENYPELMQGFKNKIKEIEPYRTALIIQKLPEHFPKWKKEAKKHFGIRRNKIIQGYIDVISAVLFEYEYPSELENKAIESIKDELYEQLEYWNEKMRKNEKTNNLSEAVALMSLGKEKFIVPENSKQIENKLQFNTHEKLFEVVIFSANEVQDKPIEGAFELLKEVWFFLNSDNATFNGKDIEKNKRPLLVNPNFLGKPDFDNFFEAEITYCSMQNKIGLNEHDFIVDISNWIRKKSKDESFSIPQKRKFNEFLEFINIKALPPQPIINLTNTKKYNAKHYLLAYLFECNAKGESYPIGNKKELERIGNERMGTGKGNRFYKVFNEIINKDLNTENNLFEIGGEYWRKAVIELSKTPELVEKYLQSKQL